MSEPPSFGSEYAKSDRSTCKLCKSTISMGSLRLSILVQSPFFDGKIPNWYHFNCFFKKANVTDTSYIKGFESLRWEDQQKINQKLGIATSNLNDSTDKENQDEDASTIDLYSIEYAKSARSKCKKCDKRIDKDVVRVMFKSKSGDGWYHLECFGKNKAELKFDFKPEDITGFDSLEEADQTLTKETIGTPQPKAQKRKQEASVKTENDNEDPEVKKVKNETVEKEKQLKIQTQEFWKLRDTLDKELPTEIIKQLIEDNEQFLKAGRDDSLNFLCDIMYFGPLAKCPECKDGQLVYRGKAYYCSGKITDWTNCTYKTQNPSRTKSFHIEADLKEDYVCLKNFKFKSQVRLFPKTFEEIEAEKKEREENKASKQPLLKLNFSLHGKLERKNDDIKTIIMRLGGKVSMSLCLTTVALISSEEEVEKMNKKMRDAQLLGIHVISEKFIDEITSPESSKGVDLEKLILKHNIASWGSDLKARMDYCIKTNQTSEAESLEAKFSMKSVGDGTGKMKMKVKGGAVVDPDSGLDDEAHVLLEAKTNEPYSCVLGMVDIMKGTNSYYKLQILEHDKMTRFYVFRSWGRVGTTIGGNKLETYGNKHDALSEFTSVYLDKTGNDWEDRKFATKKANKFFPLEMDYGEEEDSVKSKISDKNYVSKSKLHTSIQNIIKLIFDIETMKQQMKEFEIDLNKMPLGKISSNQIKQAFNILNDLMSLIDKKDNQTLIIDASNRFYTLIPHDFGMKKPTLLDNEKIIKEKTDMLNSLLDIEIAYNILKADNGSEDEDPIDLHYKKLKCEMDILDHKSDEFKRILQYVANTHAATHSNYKLIVEDVFKVRRDGEDKQYQAFKKLHNRKLLWHGSRLTNFAGILSQGLRIAPPEAPCTGYMFGKGVYFADMVSKSANYCFTSSVNPLGLMLLCEVALGDMYERTGAEYVTKLPAGKHSTKGCGRTAPNPKESYFTPEGLEIPLGNGQDSGTHHSSLLYNEYIVYDTAQIQMKYLLKVKFDYKW